MTIARTLYAQKLLPVILCGGSGTRLWPLSRRSMPKQFAALLGESSLLELTLRRLKLFGAKAIAVGADEHRFLIQDAFSREKMDSTILLEPCSKNTAAAMAIAAFSVEPEQILLFCPSDHYIADSEYFYRAVTAGISEAGSGKIVTFGVVPTFPSTGFGYIQVGMAERSERVSEVFTVKRFIEKPTGTYATQLLSKGGFFWNAGIFLVRADVLLTSLERHAEDIFLTCKNSMQYASVDGVFQRPQKDHFSLCRSESIDHAVLEKSDSVMMVPFETKWSDVGSWKSVAEFFPRDTNGNRVSGQGFFLNAKDTFIHANYRPVVAVGTQRLFVIDTLDALLIVDEEHSELVKTAVANLEAQGVAQASIHRSVARPWGSYESIVQGENFQVKRITVRPGAALSLQMHHHRAEHWIVVRGFARVTCGEKVFNLRENESTFIPKGVKHRLENTSTELLELIEVQSGTYLGEDDIVRFEDQYGRN